MGCIGSKKDQGSPGGFARTSVPGNNSFTSPSTFDNGNSRASTSIPRFDQGTPSTMVIPGLRPKSKKCKFDVLNFKCIGMDIYLGCI